MFGFYSQGNNDNAIEMLKSKKFLSFEEVYHCCSVKDLYLDPRIHSRYIELLLVMFVDVGDNHPYLDNIPYSFVSF